MAWWGIVDSITGQLESYYEGDLPGNKAGRIYVELAEKPNFDTQMWDDALRAFVPRPPPVDRDLAQEVLDDCQASLLLGTLTLPQRQELRQFLINRLGQFRFQ